jgi:hypothetical protein
MEAKSREIETTVKRICAVIITLGTGYFICHIISYLTYAIKTNV